MSATISEDGRYRYVLSRDTRSVWSASAVTFVMLNPSTADADHDDPTIRRCIRFARDWHYSGLYVVNLYAYRATSPRDLWLADDPVGPENDRILTEFVMRSELVVAAWGAHAPADRVAELADLFRRRPIHALGLTKSGAPRHPLYLPASARPIRWSFTPA
jgi:hypothetical protein